MKKFLIILIATLAIFTFNSCQEDIEAGGTAVQDMAGDWWVVYQSSVAEYDFIFGGEGAMPSVDNIENWEWDYVYDDAYSQLLTYNTASNLTDSMFITDDGHYWDFKTKVGLDYNNKTFANSGAVANLAYDDCDIEIIGGKILKDAAKSPSGMPVDSIVFYIKFSDDSYGFTFTKVSGFRRTGFPADDF